MEVTVKYLVYLFTIFLLISCGGGNVVKQTDSMKVIKKSSDKTPEWILKPKQDKEYIYIVGMSPKVDDLKNARDLAIQDATGKLIEYIGYKVTRKVERKKESIDTDDISSFKSQVVDQLTGKGTADVQINQEDFYWEQFADGTYQMYVMIKFSDKWAKEQMAKLDKLTKEQRAKSQEYLTEANTLISKNEIGKALDLAINAMVLSEKSSANIDVYDEAKNLIRLLISGISFKLENSPKYVYKDGGSDPIKIGIYSSKTKERFSGLLVTTKEINSNAVLISKTGYLSDNEGFVNFEVGNIINKNVPKMVFVVTFDIKKFDPIKDIDPEFYSELEGLQKVQELKIPLNVAISVSSCVVVIDGLKGNVTVEGNEGEIRFATKMQEAIAGEMANMGFPLISVEIPLNVINVGRQENLIKEKLINYISANYPDVKRLYFCIREVNKLGDTVNAYGIQSTGIEVVDMKLIITSIDLQSKTTIKGISLTSKGQGKNVLQAVQMAESKIIEKLKTSLMDL